MSTLRVGTVTTLYNEHDFIHPNELKRYSLGTKNKNLKRNPDGSLTLYAGAESSGGDNEANWLPAPEGHFSLYIRAYWGKARKIFWIDSVQTDENYSEFCNGLSAIGYSRSAVKQNKYDEPEFFAEYSRMPRSIHGPAAAMEWAAFRALLPDLHNKRVLDLGCGFGWHCRYVHQHGATKVVGIDLSEKMLERARTTTNAPGINYHRCAIEDIDFPANEFDIVISSLALHYVESLDRVCHKIHHCLTPNGLFLFSVEHPIFTTLPAQDWYCSPTGERLHWPIDNYQREGCRQTNWLTENVIKYHRTMATYVNMLIQHQRDPTRLDRAPGIVRTHQRKGHRTLRLFERITP